MNHIHDDQLLLYSYGDVAEGERPALESHLAACPGCRARLVELEERRVAVDWGLSRRPPRRMARLAWLALPLAAGLAALLLTQAGRTSARPPDIPEWQSHLIASPHAGYLTNGLNSLDSQLTRLERGRIDD